MKPALTAAEWAHEGGATHEIHRGIAVTDDGGATTVTISAEAGGTPHGSGLCFVGPHRHAVAALCLHGQPYGFTEKDLQLLEALLGCMDETEACASNSYRIQARSLADRIASLLPPREG